MVGAALIIFIVLFAAIILGAAWAANAAVTRLVQQRHEELDEIMATGQLPKSWETMPPIRRMTKLRRLRRYVETARLIESEETRRAMLEQLDMLRAHHGQ